MPYIEKHDRPVLDHVVEQLPDLTPGQLNYTVTRIVDQWLEQKGFSYTNIAQAVGALECVKLELYRRLAAPYENIKMVENGDVYKAGKTIWERGCSLVRTIISAFAEPPSSK